MVSRSLHPQGTAVPIPRAGRWGPSIQPALYTEYTTAHKGGGVKDDIVGSCRTSQATTIQRMIALMAHRATTNAPTVVRPEDCDTTDSYEDSNQNRSWRFSRKQVNLKTQVLECEQGASCSSMRQSNLYESQATVRDSSKSSSKGYFSAASINQARRCVSWLWALAEVHSPC